MHLALQSLEPKLALAAASLGGASRAKVDSIAPTMVSITAPANKTYAANAPLTFTLNFNEKVIVTGSPTLPIQIGSAIRDAAFVKGSNSKSLVFTTRTQPGDVDLDGIRVAGPIAFPAGAAIRDAAGNIGTGSLPIRRQSTAKVLVDTVGPSATSFGPVAINAKSKAVSLQVTFSEPATVKGKPFIPFTLNGVTRQLTYAAGSGKNVLTFTYKPARGETPTLQNVAVPSQAITLPAGASIADRLRNATSSLAAPSGVSLTPAAPSATATPTITENNAIGAVVGELSAVDADGVRDRFTYALVPGTGSDDNAAFTIDGTQLKASQRFNFEARNSYSIRIRTTDAGGLFTERAFLVTITNVNEAFTQAPVADGYISGATVYADANGSRTLDWVDGNANNAWDSGEGEVWTKTDAQGNFAADFGDPSATLRTIGGTDISTGLPFKGQLAAPPGSKVVNPLTTLVTATIAANPGITAADAVAKVQVGLGIPAGIDLTAYDPIKENNVEVQKAAAKVANVIVAAVQNGIDQAEVVSNVARTVSQGTRVDLADAGLLQSVLTVNAAPPPAAIVGNLAGDNRAVVAAGTIEDIAKVQKTSQSVQASVTENTPATATVFQADATGLVNPTFSLDGDDKASFSIDALGAVRLLTPSNYEAKSTYLFTVVAADSTGSSNTASITLRVTDVNEAPTAVALTNTTASLPENTSTAARIKVADIVVTDDALGTNVITLSGADAASFEVDGTSLFLKAGVALNFEAKASYAVTVNVADTTVAGSAAVSAAYTLGVTDVNEAPTAVALANTTASLPENTSTAARIKVADIVVTDDALGGNVITLSGADAASFEVDGTSLFLKAGVALNFEAKASYAVTVNVADATVAGSAAVSAAYTLGVTNVIAAGSTFASAIPLSLVGGQATAAGTIGPDEFTIYRAEVPTGKFVRVAVNAAVGGTFDPVVRIWSAAGTQVAVNDDSGVDLNSVATVYVPGSGADATYYVGVSGFPNFEYDPVTGAPAAAGLNQASTGNYDVFVNVLADINSSPTGLSAANNPVLGPIAAGGVVTSLDVADPNRNQGDTFAFALVTGEGDTDNFRFTISNFGELSAAATLPIGAYSIRAQVTDAAGNTFAAPITIMVVANAPPTGLTLFSDQVVGPLASGDFITSFDVVDPNLGQNDTFTFALVAGEGDTDNAKFTIGSFELVAGAELPVGNYSIRAQVTDAAGNTFATSLTITVAQAPTNAAPTAVDVTNTISALADTTDTTVALRVADIVITDDGLGVNTITLSGADATSFEVIGTSLFLKAGTSLNTATQPLYSVTVSVQDTSVPTSPAVTTSLTVEIRPLADFFTTEANATGLTITGYAGPGGSLTIPSAIGGTPVTSIGQAAFFSNGSLTAITIPASVTSIGSQAFEAMTQLTRITVAEDNSLFSSIDGVLFDKAQAVLLRFPGNRASYTSPSGVTSIADGAFRYTSGVRAVVISEGVTSIGVQAFGDSHALESVTLPDSLTSIGFWAFSNCFNLQSMRIPANVVSIGSDDLYLDAFGGCMALTAFDIAPENQSFTVIDGVLYDSAVSTLMQCPGGKIGTLSVPATVTNMSWGAINSCDQLTGIAVADGNTTYSSQNGVLFNAAATTLLWYPRSRVGGYSVPQGVTVIASSAFSGASLLTSVALPDGLLEIEGFAFGGNRQLTTVKIPATVSTIGPDAFISTGISEFYFLGDPPAVTELFPAFEGRQATVFFVRGAIWPEVFAGIATQPFDPVAA